MYCTEVDALSGVMVSHSPVSHGRSISSVSKSKTIDDHLLQGSDVSKVVARLDTSNLRFFFGFSDG